MLYYIPAFSIDKKLPVEKQTFLTFAGIILFLLGISTVHSGVIVRKPAYYLLFLALGIISRFTKNERRSKAINK